MTVTAAPPRRLPPRRPSAWLVTAFALALLLALPVATVFSFVLQPADAVWRHLVDTVLGDYIVHSLVLLVGVGSGVLVIGVGCAWLTSACHFPGRRLFEWALLLPLAMPAYIIAYTYTGLLDFAGPVQTALRAWFGWSFGDYWFPPIRSLGGAVAMLMLVLYPYVYMLARTAFLEQSVSALEVSRSLGNGPWRGFARVALPLARPAIIAGLALALMETLADYGTVQYFGVSTFTTGIFRTWYGLGDSAAAAQLAAALLCAVFILFALEHYSRRRARYHHTGHRQPSPSRYRLRGIRAALAWLACLLPLLLGFLVPVAQLLRWSWFSAGHMLDVGFARIAGQTLGLALAAALLTLLLALVLGYGRRLHPGPAMSWAVRVAGIGYAVPGAVIAVGVMLPFAALDNAVDGWLRARFGVASGLLLSGTLFAVLFAYAVRFLAVALQTVEAGLGRIKPSMDDAGRSLGLTPGGVLQRIHLPLLRGSLLTALLLVFVDVLKELPATLILRPFNFNTLAVRTFELASDERLADAAPSALAIVLVGLLPVLLLSRAIARGRAERSETDHAA